MSWLPLVPDGQDPYGDDIRAIFQELRDKVDAGISVGYNVVDYGAVLDGTTDDLDAVQAAVDAAAADGGVVVLPSGTCLIRDSVVWHDKVSLRGQGQDVSILKMTDGGNAYCIEFSEETRGVFFEDVTVDGGAQTTGGGGILANGSVECRFFRVHFTNCFNWALVLGPNADDSFGHNNSVLNCWFDSGMAQTGYGSGIHITSNDENWIIANDFVYMGGTNTPPDADGPCCVFDQSGLNYHYMNNFVNGDHSVKGIHSKDMVGIRIIGNNFDGLAGDNVDISGSKNIIQGNYFSEPAKESAVNACGIKIGYAAKHITISNNVLKTGASGTDSLLKITGDGDPRDIIVTGNILDGTDGSPVVGLFDIATTVINCVIRDNVGISTMGGTAERPDATKLPPGVSYYDTDLWQPLWTDDGGNWRNATGTVV